MISGGNPNKLIRKRFDDDTIQKLLETKWWNLSDEQIDDLSVYLLSKIFDCVTFFEENRLMQLRFNILNKYVDHFVVCEGKFDHQGKKKKINFNKNKYPKFKKKITHILVGKFPKNLNPWERQAFQREKILAGLTKANENDLILFSDPDEIPNISELNKINFKKKYIIFLQDLFIIN